MKGYEDLSRRALIKLGKDFDDANDAALMKYLSENEDMYENIRFAEKVICKADNIVESFRGMRPAVKNIIQKHGEKVIDAVIDSVITVSDDAEKGLLSLKESISDKEETDLITV